MSGDDLTSTERRLGAVAECLSGPAAVEQGAGNRSGARGVTTDAGNLPLRTRASPPSESGRSRKSCQILLRSSLRQ
jgi:hypothetical protein